MRYLMEQYEVSQRRACKPSRRVSRVFDTPGDARVQRVDFRRRLGTWMPVRWYDSPPSTTVLDVQWTLAQRQPSVLVHVVCWEV